MRIVSLTIPKPTLSNEDEIRSISLTIKSKSNGVQIIDSWPYAFPRYKYELDDVLEISIYYKLKKSSNKLAVSDEIHLHSVIYFPCILLSEIDKKGKKQWILGLDRFSDNSVITSSVSTPAFESENNIDHSLKQIRMMEEKAKKSFKISKIYLIFYSCNKTVLNIEEQLTVNTINNSNPPKLNHCLLLNDVKEEKKMHGFVVSKSFLQYDQFEKSNNKTYTGIRPEDSISRVSAKTSNSNTISRTNLIKQNLTDDSDNLSNAIEMINKYRSKALNGIKSVEYASCYQNDNINSPMISITHPPPPAKIQNQQDYENPIEKKEFDFNTKIVNVDTASIISRTISTNKQKYFEKKLQQERLFRLQYYFTFWRQITRKEKSIKESRKNVKIMSGIVTLFQILEKNQRNKEMFFVQRLKFNSFSYHINRKEFELKQINNEKSILAEKLNNIIIENCENLQKINQNILIKEKDIFELRKKLEYYENMNNEFKEGIQNLKIENKKLLNQINDLKDYIEDKEKLIESEKVRNNKEKIEFEIIIDRRKKEYSRQLEEIHYLNSEINELKGIINLDKNKNEELRLENEELSKKLLNLEEEKMNIINEYNENLLLKSRENEELYMENIKYKEENELIVKSNNNYIKICEDLKNEKSSLIGSVYDLINQIENEKIERIQELENSRMLFQSINNRGGGNINKNLMNLYNIEMDEDEDLRLEDLKYTKINDWNNKESNQIKKKQLQIEKVVGVNNIEIIENRMIEKEFEGIGGIGGGIGIGIGIKSGNGIKSGKMNKKYVKLESLEIKGRNELIKNIIREQVRIEFYDDDYKNIKLKNEQILDLSERVRILTDEMRKLKEKEESEDKKKNRISIELLKEMIDNENLELNMDDTDKIIGSATEMFKLALKNIKMNKDVQLVEELESERPTSGRFGLKQEDDEMNENNKSNEMLMIVPSEFSFSTSTNLNSNSCNNTSSVIMRKVSDENLNNYHQYSIENKSNINNKMISNTNEGSNYKVGFDNVESGLISVPRLITGSGLGLGSGSGLGIGSGMKIKESEITYSQMRKNNPIILQFPMLRTSSSSTRSSSQSPAAILSRSNSMGFNISNNNNNNIGGYYYQYNNMEENKSQKRYNSLPRQNIRTVPPLFFPRS